MNRGEHRWKSKAIWMSDDLSVVRGVDSVSVAVGYLAPLNQFENRLCSAGRIGSRRGGTQ